MVNLVLLEGAFAFVSWLFAPLVEGRPFFSLFRTGWPLPQQIGLGLLFGSLLAALAAVVTLKSHAFVRLQRLMRDVLNHLRPTSLDVVIASGAAGIGEELLFRATLQPVVGIWLASLAFALAHVGVVKPLRAKVTYASYVFAMGMVLGLVYTQVGLVSAIVTHAVYDMTVLFIARSYLQQIHT